ncbi:DUF2088 domain-containing protein [candidate division GN15 bacterium]|nr:DUF2088 domain-containing protein [candidate division GN15 bacterium]
MDISLAYGKATRIVTIPDGVEVDTFISRGIDTIIDRATFLERFAASGGERLLDAPFPLMIVNDGYRHTPTARILAWLNSAYPERLDRADFLIATGTHPAPTEPQYRGIFGDLYDQLKSRILVHDCRDLESMEVVGRDRFGGEVYLNKAVLEHDNVLIIGSVEPHYFAGFTGGRKSLFPGVSDLATTERNHNLANSLDARPMRLRGNPVAQHFEELMTFVETREFYTVQIVMDADHNIREVCCGSLNDAFARACEVAARMYGCTADDTYDVVLCEMRPPLDKNLYQLQKGLENCRSAVHAGGAAIVVSACEEGVGSEHFFNQALTWDRHKNRPKDGILRFGSHKLSRVNAMTRRIDVLLHSELPHHSVKQVFYEPIDDITHYLAERRASHDLDRLAVVYDAGHTVVTVNKDN